MKALPENKEGASEMMIVMEIRATGNFSVLFLFLLFILILFVL
jgi:hypothetical protein